LDARREVGRGFDCIARFFEGGGGHGRSPSAISGSGNHALVEIFISFGVNA
jgi:hypothetical protein